MPCDFLTDPNADSTFTGNFYSLSNETDQDAKIFFSQGCEMAPEPADQFDPGVTA